MAHAGRGRQRRSWRHHYTWRHPRPGEEFHFELLVSMRWTALALAALTSLAATLAVLPHPRRLRMLNGLLLAGLGSGLVALVEGMRGAAFPTVQRVELPIDDLPPALDGLTIGQLTDLHLGVPLTHQSVRRAVEAMRAAAPDILALTGDYISFSRHLPELHGALRGLAARHGLYAVFGNHDHWTELEAIAEVFHELGITLLVNQHVVIEHGGARLAIAGVDDVWDGRPDLGAALQGAPEHAPIILLAHAPDYADIAAASPVAVQLAGHTHAGHIRLPWLGPMFLPRHGLRYHRGLHRVGRMWLYVSHGLGGWPIRIGSRAEATIFTLRRAGAITGNDPRPTNTEGA